MVGALDPQQVLDQHLTAGALQGQGQQDTEGLLWEVLPGHRCRTTTRKSPQ